MLLKGRSRCEEGQTYDVVLKYLYSQVLIFKRDYEYMIFSVCEDYMLSQEYNERRGELLKQIDFLSYSLEYILEEGKGKQR
jgi:hypothetical protein